MSKQLLYSHHKY